MKLIIPRTEAQFLQRVLARVRDDAQQFLRDEDRADSSAPLGDGFRRMIEDNVRRLDALVKDIDQALRGGS